MIGGAGKVAEIDGAYFGGYVKPANHIEKRVDRRLAENRTGKRQSVIIIRERNGNSVPAVFKSESAALGWIKSRIQPGTVVNADEAAGWDGLNSRFEMRRINHTEAYSADGACTNMAEEYFSACAALKAATITISPGLTCFATHMKSHGAKTIAAWQMANRSARLPTSP